MQCLNFKKFERPSQKPVTENTTRERKKPKQGHPIPRKKATKTVALEIRHGIRI